MAGGIALQSSSGGTVTFTIPETSTSSTINLDFTSLKSANGYQKLPGGLIIQWGMGTVRNGYNPFPIAFPNALLSFVISPEEGQVYINTSTNSGYTPQDIGTVCTNTRFIAIGY